MNKINLLTENQETPDIIFSEETPNLIFSEETPNLNFSEETPNLNFSNDEKYLANEDDIDDLDEPDQYIEEETENPDDSDSGEDNTDDNITTTDPKSKHAAKPTDDRLVKLPLARVKQIMKADPEISLITAECLFAVTKATELFIESLAQESFIHTAQAKKRTVQKGDVDLAISAVDSLLFLEGAINF